VIELTKDNIAWEIGFNFHNLLSHGKVPLDHPLVKQLLDDYEKARKFDEIKDGTLGFIRAFNWLDKNKSIFTDQNKLQELIEKEIVFQNETAKVDPSDHWWIIVEILQKLLEASKK